MRDRVFGENGIVTVRIGVIIEYVYDQRNGKGEYMRFNIRA
jgi:hypothetical protein